MKKKFSITPYLFIAPHLLFFIVFLIIPTVSGIVVSFFKWDYLTPPKFVGLKNYANLINSETIDYIKFWSTFGNTAKFVLFTVPILVVLGLFFAVILNENFSFNRFVRFAVYSPIVLSVTVACMIWRWLLEDNAGLINHYLEMLGFERIHWLAQQPFIWITFVIITVWWQVGMNFIFFLAALQEVPAELYEAASMDGARAWVRFWHVTLPCIKRTTFFVLVVTTLGQFNVFGQPHILFGGRMPDDVRVLLNYIRDVAFNDFRMGAVSAMTMIMGLAMILVSVVQFKLLKADD